MKEVWGIEEEVEIGEQEVRGNGIVIVGEIKDVFSREKCCW